MLKHFVIFTFEDNFFKEEHFNEYVDAFMKVINDCEFARYAPGDPEANMEQVYDSSIETISKMEDNL